MKETKNWLRMASATVVASALVFAGTSAAISASSLDTAWGGYVVCISKADASVKIPLKSKCPAGYTTKIFGARGQAGRTGAQGVAGATGAQGSAGRDASAESVVLTPSDFAVVGPYIGMTNILGYDHNVLVLPAGSNFVLAAPFVPHSSWANATSFRLEITYVTSSEDSSTWTLEHGINGYSVGDPVLPNVTAESTITPSPAGPTGLQKAVVTTGVYKGSVANSEYLEILIGRWGTPENLNPAVKVFSVKVSPNF